MNEEIYGSFSKDVANNLDITTSTLRRWSIALEKSGYHFEKNDKDQRIYFERDYKSLREIKSLLKSGRGFDECVHAVIARVQHEEKTLSVHEPDDQEVRLSKRDFEEIINKASEDAAMKAVEFFANKMMDKIEARDRIVMSQLADKMSEQRKMIEESAASKEPKKRKWWKLT